MRITMLSLALTLGLLGAACGGEGEGGVASLTGDSASGSASSADQDRQEQALEWAECMRRNGVDVPDPEFDDNGMMLIEPGQGPQPTEQDMEDAHAACQDLMPEPGNVTISEEEKAAMRDAGLRFAECMREQGINVPDPGPDGNMAIPIGGKDGFDPDDPDFVAAQEECHPILDEVMGGPSSGVNAGGDDS